MQQGLNVEFKCGVNPECDSLTGSHVLLWFSKAVHIYIFFFIPLGNTPLHLAVMMGHKGEYI